MTRREERRIVRAEATLLRVPLFALAVKGLGSLDGIEFRHLARRREETVDAIIRTERDAALPYPGPLSRRIHMAFLSLIGDSGLPFANPLEWNWRELCRRMDLPNSGKRDGEFKQAIRASWGLKIFGLQRLDRRSTETWRRLYAECEFKNELREDGSVAERNRLWLAPWYLESLNAFHTAPVDYALWKRLEQIGPLASRLYEYLIPAFFKREELQLSYERLASAMPVVCELRRSHAIRQFAPALEALQAEGIIALSAWDAMKGSGRPKLIVTRGAKLTPREQPVADTAAEVEDHVLCAQIIAEFYRLLGRDVRPVRADDTVATSLITRVGAERVLELLPESVRRLKSRFRNAETMGALLRYFEEVLAEDERKQQGRKRHERERVEREAALTLEAEEDSRAKAAWAALGDAEKAAIRSAVLAEQPGLRRYAALLEAASIHRLATRDGVGKRGHAAG
jgi:hypothetical protein